MNGVGNETLGLLIIAFNLTRRLDLTHGADLSVLVDIGNVSHGLVVHIAIVVSRGIHSHLIHLFITVDLH